MTKILILMTPVAMIAKSKQPLNVKKKEILKKKYVENVETGWRILEKNVMILALIATGVILLVRLCMDMNALNYSQPNAIECVGMEMKMMGRNAMIRI